MKYHHLGIQLNNPERRKDCCMWIIWIFCAKRTDFQETHFTSEYALDWENSCLHFLKIYHIKKYYYLQYCLFSVLCISSLNNMFSKGSIQQILLQLINFTFMFHPFEVKFIRKMNASNSYIDIWRIGSGI